MKIEIESAERIKNLIEDLEKIRIEKSVNYIDAILIYCEQNKIEEETLATYIKQNPSLKEKIKIDAENLNFLPKTQRLPI